MCVARAGMLMDNSFIALMAAGALGLIALQWYCARAGTRRELNIATAIFVGFVWSIPFQYVWWGCGSACGEASLVAMLLIPAVLILTALPMLTRFIIEKSCRGRLGLPESPAAPEIAATVTVHIDGATHEVGCAPGETVLQAVRRAGLNPPSACEDGYCGCCMARLLHGRVEMARCHALEPDEVAEGWILTCQSHPQTPELEVRYD